MPIVSLKSELSAVSWDIAQLRTDKRTTYSIISSELHIISNTYPFTVNLKERPYETSGIIITGFTEVLVQPTSELTFYVDWESGTVYFHSNDAGKLVSVYYTGTGSVISACDVNKFADFLSSIRGFLTAFSIEVTDPISTNINFIGGYVNTGTALSLIADKILRFATGQEYETIAMTIFYWKKILISVNTTTGTITITEGTAASTEALAAIPIVPANCIPCSVISVQDNGGAGAGTIQDITLSNIQDVRAAIS